MIYLKTFWLLIIFIVLLQHTGYGLNFPFKIKSLKKILNKKDLDLLHHTGYGLKFPFKIKSLKKILNKKDLDLLHHTGYGPNFPFKVKSLKKILNKKDLGSTTVLEEPVEVGPRFVTKVRLNTRQRY